MQAKGTVNKNIAWKVRGGLEYIFVGREESSQYKMRFAASGNNAMDIRAFDVKNELPSIVGAVGADMDISKQVSLSLTFDINAGIEATAFGAGLGVNYSFGNSAEEARRRRLAKNTAEEDVEVLAEEDEALEIGEPQEMSSIIDDRLVLDLLVEVNGKQQWITPLIINSSMYKDGTAELQDDSERFIISKMKELAKYRDSVKRIRVERHVPAGKTPDNADMRLSSQRAVLLYRILIREAKIKTPQKTSVRVRNQRGRPSPAAARGANANSAATPTRPSTPPSTVLK